MNLTNGWLDAVDGENALAATVEFRDHGGRREVDAADLSRVAFENADPVRRFPSWPGKRHYEGKFWMSSTGQHVPFESFWERGFLASLDRTSVAVAVASQPMWIRWRQPKASHAPDFFVRRNDGSAALVDVRPREVIKAHDAEIFARTGRLAAAYGWEYEVFSELSAALDQNLRFLLRYRGYPQARRRCGHSAGAGARSSSSRVAKKSRDSAVSSSPAFSGVPTPNGGWGSYSAPSSRKRA